MPQLWTETFVSQYFWFAVVLLGLYYFIVTKIIPNVANAIKARQINESADIKTEIAVNTNLKTSELLNQNSKQDHSVQLLLPNWETVQNEWLLTAPENNNIYWIETNLTEESKLQLEAIEEDELSLEDFLKIEEKSGE